MGVFLNKPYSNLFYSSKITPYMILEKFNIHQYSLGYTIKLYNKVRKYTAAYILIKSREY